MARLTCLGFCLLFAPLASASAGTKKVLLWAAAPSPEDPASQTLRAIDANEDGRIDRSEVSAFAQSEGLDLASATEDFAGIDTNGDGTLDPAELIQVVGSGVHDKNTTSQDVPSTQTPSLRAAVATPSAAVATPTPSLRATQPVPHVVTGLTADKPVAKNLRTHEARISFQDTHPARVLTPMAQKVQIPHAAVATTPAPPKIPQAPQADAVKPTPVERMVKHFAQVLRTAEVVPIRVEPPIRAEPPKPVVAKPKPVEARRKKATDTRATVESAAKEVSEQLFIAESAEAKARVLDRKAAEELANATVLAKLTTQEALNAGATAAHNKANELLGRIAKLEDQAERAEVRSAALHSKAKLETDEASELMAVADRALNHSPKQPL